MKKKALIFKLIALSFSLILGLVVCELVVRIIRPDLRELAQVSYQRDSYRIFANSPNETQKRMHPDTGVEHPVLTNSLGMRQHRNFEAKKADGVTRIGVFGDSFTENVRMEAPYSFSEPLEYLLARAGNHVEVMNFAVDGYGTDQMYLQHRYDTEDLDLDIIVYLCCHNDPIDIYTNKLFKLTDEGGIEYAPEKKGGLWVKFVQRLALTYLIMQARSDSDQQLLADVYGRDKNQDKKDAQRLKREVHDTGISRFSKSEAGSTALKLYAATLREWRELAEERGQEFVVVLLPRLHSLHDPIRKAIEADGAPLIDLAELISAENHMSSSLFFENDNHWNEEGNQYAAAHMFQQLSKRIGGNYADDEDFIRTVLSQYYGVFGKEPVSEVWMDPGAPPLSEDDAAKLRNTYLELELK